MENSEFLDTLKKYLMVLLKKYTKAEAIFSLDYKQRVGIFKDIQDLCDKAIIESQKADDSSRIEECKALIERQAIPYLSKFIQIEDNVVAIQQEMEILKGIYRIMGKISLKHFIVFYEWDWEEKSKFYEPRQEILDGYCHYLEKLVIDPEFTDVIAMLPSRLPVNVQGGILIY